jgi:hypothetical protein
MRAFILASLLLCSSIAAAKDSPEQAARKMLAIQAGSIQLGDKRTFGEAFSPEAIAFFPGADEPGFGPEGIAAAMGTAWLDSPETIEKIKIDDVVAGAIGDDAIWFTATLTFQISMEGAGPKTHSTKTVRVTELAVRDAPWTAAAAHFSAPLDNDRALKMARDGFGELPAIRNPTERGPVAAWLASSTELANHVAEDAAASALGSDAKEKGIGGAKARALLKSFGGKMEILGKVREVEVAGARYVAANVQLTFTSKKETLVVPYRVLLIAIRGSGGDWKLVSAHFSNGVS